MLKRKVPSGFEDAPGFGVGRRLVGEEHDAELADDGIELAGVERQGQRVGLAPGGARRAFPAVFDHRVVEVRRRHGAGLEGGEELPGHDPGPGGQFQDPPGAVSGHPAGEVGGERLEHRRPQPSLVGLGHRAHPLRFGPVGHAGTLTTVTQPVKSSPACSAWHCSPADTAAGIRGHIFRPMPLAGMLWARRHGHGPESSVPVAGGQPASARWVCRLPVGSADPADGTGRHEPGDQGKRRQRGRGGGSGPRPSRRLGGGRRLDRPTAGGVGRAGTGGTSQAAAAGAAYDPGHRWAVFRRRWRAGSGRPRCGPGGRCCSGAARPGSRRPVRRRRRLRPGRPAVAGAAGGPDRAPDRPRGRLDGPGDDRVGRLRPLLPDRQRDSTTRPPRPTTRPPTGGGASPTSPAWSGDDGTRRHHGRRRAGR